MHVLLVTASFLCGKAPEFDLTISTPDFGALHEWIYGQPGFSSPAIDPTWPAPAPNPGVPADFAQGGFSTMPNPVSPLTFAGSLSGAQWRQIDQLRAGNDIYVQTVEEARQLLAHMPDMRPYTEVGLLPNPDRIMSGGFRQPNGTWRGDLINTSDPTGPIHPDVANLSHANNPHYNRKLPDGEKATIVIVGG